MALLYVYVKSWVNKLAARCGPESLLSDPYSGILKLYAKCSAERLFMPWVLPDEDAAIHLDTDLFFMRPPEDLWQYYKRMDGDDVFGVVPAESYYTNIGNSVS